MVLTPGQRPMWWLSWAAAPYEMATRLRAYGYEHGWFARRHLPVPVISIGNLTVGGTGKTPLVIQITEWLLEAGRRVAVLSRGYRRTSREPLLLVSDGARIVVTAEEAGDEPFLIAQRCPRAVLATGFGDTGSVGMSSRPVASTASSSTMASSTLVSIGT